MSSLQSPTDLPALRRWVVAFCLVRFDLERGQVLESAFPPNSLSPSLELQISFNSFPDSSSHHLPHHRSSVHDSIFFFRSPTPPPSPSPFLYGFVFNRQRHDDRLKRGGEHKSVVILSHSPYPSVFRPLLQILAPLCFDLGPRALELVASHVAAWPPPSPGLPVLLPLGSSSTLRALLPLDSSLSLFPDSDIFGSFRGILLHLWLLWELVIIGEPILIIAPTPPQCSEAVAALVGLAAPLPSSLDFRPYFTIHDPDFARLNSLQEGEEFPPMVLGVTNLFFLKALRSVPHVVSVGCVGPNSGKLPVPQNAPRSVSVPSGSVSRPKFSPLGLLNAMKTRREGPLCLMTEHREAVWSSYNATMKPDTSVLNRLVDAGVSHRVEESMSVVNNEILRRHFLELTTNFLAPFGPYLRAAAPLEGSSPYAEPPPLPAFQADEFLKGLAVRGPGKFLSKRMRANWLDLYKRFLSGRNFMPWFQKRRAVVEQEQHRLWRQARVNLDIHKFILTMSELEIVDSFNAIERHLLHEIQAEKSGKGVPDYRPVCQKLKADLQAVYNVLPKDMQQLLFLNPQRASLLQGSLELTKLPGHPSVHDDLLSDRTVPISPR